MTVIDLEEFVQECLRAYDPNIDLSIGSVAQQRIIQPLLRRIGPDPLTMDLEKFIGTRLVQEFPDISTDDGDAIMDFLVGPARVLLEPLVQEVKRVRDNLSFRDPNTLTLTEAEALGANYFAPREQGDFARVLVRLYFTAPQNVVITPGNYAYTGTGLRFPPTAIQSIDSNQMLFNREGSYYYFDVSTIADSPGEGYNIEPGRVVGVYGVSAAVKATNKLRAVGGTPEEQVEEYIDRIEQDLTERSLVTQRGIMSVIRKNFPAITRKAVVGFNDPEMQRDILMGQGVGPIVLSGSLGFPITDGSGGPSKYFRVSDAGIDFTAMLGAVGSSVRNYTLSVAGPAFLAGTIGDLAVVRVVDSTTLEVSTSVFKPWYAGIQMSYWMLRKNELTLSGVAGGTAFPGQNGEVIVNSGEVHIGGMTDIYGRSATLDAGAINLEAVTDDAPLLLGVRAGRYPVGAGPWTGFILIDFILGVNYQDGDEVFSALDAAKDEGLVLQVMDGDAGSYRILDVIQIAGQPPAIITDPAPAGYPLSQRWRLLDTIDVDLAVPKETKLSGTDLFTVQGNDFAQIASAVDLSVYGIGAGDFLELFTGPDIGVYPIVADTTTNQLQIDSNFKQSTAGVSYAVYRKLSTSSVSMPFVRIRDIDVLDSSGEPIGVTIPYADPVDARSFDFTTPTNSPTVDIRDGVIGCVGKPIVDPTTVNGKVLTLHCPLWAGTGRIDISFAGITAIGEIADRINTTVSAHVAGVVDGNRIGISPFRMQYRITAMAPMAGVSALYELFDSTMGNEFATNHIRSDSVANSGGWARFTYDLNFHAVHVISVNATGFASQPASVQTGAALSVSEDFPPAINSVVRVGPRAVGRVRFYFLNPTTFEVAEGARVEAVLEDGTRLGFVPDPTISSRRYPPPPAADGATDGVTTSELVGSITYGRFESSEVDFIKKGIVPGDKLVVSCVPIVGTKAQSGTNVPGLALSTLVVKVSGIERTIVFGNDDPSDLTAVTLSGIERQLNRVLGAGVTSFTSGGMLQIVTSYELEILGGTAAGYFWLVFPVGGVSNLSDNYNGGTPYTIFYVSNHHVLTLEQFVSARSSQQFFIIRPGAQRTGTTQMSVNTAYAGLYFADVQVVSEGTGQEYNLPAGTLMEVSGHKSLGYRVSTEHPHLAFSIAERPRLHVSPTIVSIGASDDPENAIQVSGQNLKITYDWSAVLASLHNFVTSDSERVVTENALVRHLIPHFVRFDLRYRGGSDVTRVRQEIDRYIAGLNPDDPMEAVRIQNIPITMGASSVSTPVNLVAVVHAENRRVTLQQSTNYLNSGRLAGFFVEQVNVTRD